MFNFSGINGKIAFVSPFGDLGVTHTVYLWLDGKRVVDFLLARIHLSKSAFSEGVGHYEQTYYGDVARNPSMNR